MIMLIGAIIALILAVISLVESGPRNLLAWAVIALAAAHLIAELA